METKKITTQGAKKKPVKKEVQKPVAAYEVQAKLNALPITERLKLAGQLRNGKLDLSKLK